jgi:hypothetical protein
LRKDAVEESHRVVCFCGEAITEATNANDLRVPVRPSKAREFGDYVCSSTNDAAHSILPKNAAGLI